MSEGCRPNPLWYRVPARAERITTGQGPHRSTRIAASTDVRSLRALVQSRQGASSRFDISVRIRRRGQDGALERTLIRSLAEAGATWCTEYITPTDPGDMRARIALGPLTMD